jgi:hypothetical protein
MRRRDIDPIPRGSIVARQDRQRWLEWTAVFAGFRVGLAHIRVRRCHRALCPMLIRLAIGAHDTKVMLGMLEQIFGDDSVAARRRLTRQC